MYGKTRRRSNSFELRVLFKRYVAAARVDRSGVQCGVKQFRTSIGVRRRTANDLRDVRAVARKMNEPNADQRLGAVDQRPGASIHRDARQHGLPFVSVDRVAKHLRRRRRGSNRRHQERQGGSDLFPSFDSQLSGHITTVTNHADLDEGRSVWWCDPIQLGQVCGQSEL